MNFCPDLKARVQGKYDPEAPVKPAPKAPAKAPRVPFGKRKAK